MRTAATPAMTQSPARFVVHSSTSALRTVGSAAYVTFIAADTVTIYDGVAICPIVSATVSFFVLQNFRFAVPVLPGIGGPRSARF
jgi:hypothetical protein